MFSVEISLTYDFHENLFPVFTCLKAFLQGRRLWEAGEQLLDEGLPLEKVGIGLKRGLPLVCGLGESRSQSLEVVCWKAFGA